MACGKMNYGDYEKMKKWTGKEGDIDPMTCAEYFFDGRFNVVRLYEGISVYHGSSSLVRNMAPFPLGKDYYDKNGVKINNLGEEESPEEYISKRLENEISPSWFGSFKTAQIYSSQTDSDGVCGVSCILAYKTTRPLTLLLLNDPYNLDKLRRFVNKPEFDQQISVMFSSREAGYLPKERETGFLDPLRKHGFDHFIRHSSRNFDIPFSQELKKVLGNDYDGYCCPKMKRVKKAPNVSYDRSSVFHEELIFFNPVKFLERDTKNPKDRFYFPSTGIPSVDSYIKSLSLFETINVDFHAGNLLEHSVWSLLWAEKLLDIFLQNTNPFPFCSLKGGNIEFQGEVSVRIDVFKKIVSCMAFLHDITKMGAYEDMLKNVTRKKFLYFEVEEHTMRNPLIYPTFNDDLDKIRHFSTLDILREMVPEIEYLPGEIFGNLGKDLLEYISRFHRDFGVELLGPLVRGENFQERVDSFSRKHYRQRHPKFFLIILLIVSWADIAARQPYGVIRKRGTTSLINGIYYQSELFPYIKNMTRVYSGGNLDRQLNIFETNDIWIAMSECLKRVHFFAFNQT